MTDTIAKSLGDLMEYLEALPEQAPEEIAAEKENHEKAVRIDATHRALGSGTGWPEKYLEAVSVNPRGEKWLSAFQIAKQKVESNAILVLYGKRGAGKTRMAAELAMVVGRSQYRTAMRFFLEVRASFRKDAPRSELEIITELTKTPLLILDEIQERGETPFEDRLLTHLIDARYAANKPTIIIANLTKSELAQTLGNSIVSRAQENGKSIEFDWPSYRITQTKPENQ